jgi:hypothetical protein
VLLAAAADGENLAKRDAVLFHLRENQVERLRPHQRRAVFDERVAVGQDAVPRAIMRQHVVEVQGLFVNHLARVEVNDDGAQALRAGIESEKKSGHVIFEILFASDSRII